MARVNLKLEEKGEKALRAIGRIQLGQYSTKRNKAVHCTERCSAEKFEGQY